jgi:hypothetical protein
MKTFVTLIFLSRRRLSKNLNEINIRAKLKTIINLAGYLIEFTPGTISNK